MHKVEKCAMDTLCGYCVIPRDFQILMKTLTAPTVSLMCTSTGVTASSGLAILPSCCCRG